MPFDPNSFDALQRYHHYIVIDPIFTSLPMEHDIPMIHFSGIPPHQLVPKFPYGLTIKYHDPNPGVPMQEEIKMFYYLKPSYFFMHNQISKNPFCVVSVLLGGHQEDLEFAEKSLDLGKENFKSRVEWIDILVEWANYWKIPNPMLCLNKDFKFHSNPFLKKDFKPNPI